jgi:hypothetical protein
MTIQQQELAQSQKEAIRLREVASDRLRTAYEQDKHNPLLLVHLSNNFFYSDLNSTKRDYKRVGDLAKEIFKQHQPKAH